MAVVAGDERNVKITTADDLRGGAARSARRRASAPATTCIGSSTAGRSCWPASSIPVERGPLGHSDGDVVCHALVDAMLRRGGGRRHRPAFSEHRSALEGRAGPGPARARRRDRRATRLAPSRAPTSRSCSSGRSWCRTSTRSARRWPAVLGVAAERVSVKAKTNEGVDAVGRGEAIAAHAVAVLVAGSDAAMTRPRVRFAPSPTGQLHVGNARTALFNWLLARAARRRRSSCASRTPTPSDRRASRSRRSSTTCAGWGSTGTRGRTSAGRTARTASPSGSTLYQAAAARARRARPRLLLLLHARAARSRARRRRWPQACRRSTAAGAGGRSRRRGGRRVARAARRRRCGLPCRAGRDVTFHDLVRGDVTFSTRRHRRSRHRPVRRAARLQLRRRRRRRADGDHARDSRRGSHLEHAAAGADLRGAGRRAAGVRASVARARARSRAAVEAARRDERGRVPRARLSARGARQLPRAARLVARGRTRRFVPLAEMARRFDLTTVSHSAAVFDTAKLAWMNRHYMKEAAPARRRARGAAVFRARRLRHRTATDARSAYLESLLPMAVGSVDRLEEIPERVAFVFDWDAGACGGAGARGAGRRRARSTAFAEAIATVGPLDRERSAPPPRGRASGRGSRAARCFIRSASR